MDREADMTRVGRLVDLDEPTARRPELAGAKASMLAQLRAAGVPVPDGWIVPADVSELAPEELAHLEAALARWGAARLRSSARLEDGRVGSFAGVYRSARVLPGGVAAAVEALRAAASSIQRRGDAPDEGPIALLLQDEVQGPGGVYLSLDPFRPGPLIELCTSGADDVTSGRGGDRIEPDDVPALVAIARFVEDHLGGPADIEFACEAQAPVLLQARPQTGLHRDPAERAAGPTAPDPSRERSDGSARLYASARGACSKGAITRELLAPYLPHRVVPLVAALWAETLSRALQIDIIVADGLLYSRGEPVETGAAWTPAEAIARWPALRRRWRRRLAASARFARSRDPWSAWHGSLGTWRAFMGEYLGGPLHRAIEGARSSLEASRSALPPGRVRTRRLADLERVRRLIVARGRWDVLATRGVRAVLTSDDAVSGALAKLLRRWGHWSEQPEDFGRPYPAEDPELLRTALLFGSLPRTDASTLSLEAEVVAIGDEDNDLKYRACVELRYATLRLGEHLAATGAHERPEDIWWLELDALVHGRIARAAPAAAHPCSALGAAGSSWWGTPLAPGRASGVVWSGQGPPPANAVLVAPALGALGALVIERCAAIIVGSGTPACHAAIVAREARIPMLACAAAVDALRTGDAVFVDATRGHARRQEESR